MGFANRILGHWSRNL